jgi:CRP-like cAMP-binding protein
MRERFETTRPPNSSPTPERRTSPRVALASRVDVEIDGNPDVAHGASLDLGIGGLCIRLAEAAPLERVTGIRIPNGRRELMLRARGAWQRKSPSDESFMLGVEFLSPGPGELTALWQLLNQRALELSRFLVDQSEFADTDIDILMDLALCTRRREFGAGVQIYVEGAAPWDESSIFIVAQGCVGLSARGASARVDLGSAGVGEVFGGIPTVLGIPHVDGACALTPVQLLEVDAFSLESLAREKPLVARTLERAALRQYMRRMSAVFVAHDGPTSSGAAVAHGA